MEATCNLRYYYLSLKRQLLHSPFWLKVTTTIAVPFGRVVGRTTIYLLLAILPAISPHIEAASAIVLALLANFFSAIFPGSCFYQISGHKMLPALLTHNLQRNFRYITIFYEKTLDDRVLWLLQREYHVRNIRRKGKPNILR